MCLVHEIHFQGPLEVIQQSRKDKFNGVPALVCHPSYNIRQIAGLLILEHDQFSLQHMKIFIKLVFAVMDVWEFMDTCSAPLCSIARNMV